MIKTLKTYSGYGTTLLYEYMAIKVLKNVAVN